MPDRTCIRVPKYRLHKPTGLAVVRLGGRDLYIGPYGTPESEARYKSVVAEWLKIDRKLLPKSARVAERENLVVNELTLAYLEFAFYLASQSLTSAFQSISAKSSAVPACLSLSSSAVSDSKRLSRPRYIRCC